MDRSSTEDAGISRPSFDYSTADAVEELKGVSGLILEIREELDFGALKGLSGLVLEVRDELSVEAVSQPTMRKIALYERTLGLAVIPVLLRRAAYKIRWKISPPPASTR
jgi:hypothetical protein